MLDDSGGWTDKAYHDLGYFDIPTRIPLRNLTPRVFEVFRSAWGNCGHFLTIRDPLEHTYSYDTLGPGPDSSVGHWHRDVFPGTWMFLWTNVGPTEFKFLFQDDHERWSPPPGHAVLVNNDQIVHRATFTREQAAYRFLIRSHVHEYCSMSHERIERLKDNLKYV